tara:strand:+ start:3212 stop:3799 length:588 start_codon:yes stop_codon:yes gene_type:complete
MRFYIYVFLLTNTFIMAQERLPMDEIPTPTSTLKAGDIISRMIQGLGYRFYWASKDLRTEDLSYRPSKDGASSLETLQHIYGLSLMILNAYSSTPNKRPLRALPEDYRFLRQSILTNLDQSAQLYSGKSEEEVHKMNVVFERDGKISRFPVWNLLNGPFSDAIYHTGQLVSFQLTTGNPIQKGVSVFLGKTKAMK